ncbi:MAG: hypothetical protein ABJ360_17820 [Roseobacter sp.]
MATVKHQMRIETFDALLDKHGSDLNAWPSAEQEPARELLKMCSAAKNRLEEEQALKALLTSHQPRFAPEGLAAKILKKAREIS